MSSGSKSSITFTHWQRRFSETTDTRSTYLTIDNCTEGGGLKSSRSSDWLESEPSSPVVFEGIGRDRQGQYWQT